MMTIQFYIGLIVLIAAAVAFFITANWEHLKASYDAHKGRTYSEQIDFIFSQIWNGEEASREAAWYRTIQHLKHGTYPEEMVIEAELRLLFLQYGQDNRQPRRSEYKVSSNGRVVHITEIGGRGKDDDPGPVEA